VKLIDEKQLKEPEELVVISDIFVKEHGEQEAKARKYGDKVTVSGLDKAELLYRHLAVTPAEFAKMPKKKPDTQAQTPEK
jgi:hypothetical protein